MTDEAANERRPSLRRVSQQRTPAVAAWPPPPSGPRHRWRVRWLAEWVSRLAGEGPILDLGCGHGTLARRLASRGFQVLAMDIDLARLRPAQRMAQAGTTAGPPIHFVGDGTAIPLPDDCLSLVVAGEVLEHIADEAACVREVARVLRPGGRFVVTVPAGAHRYGALDRYAGHHRRYDREQLWALATGNGLEVEVLRGWGFPVGRLYDQLLQAPALQASGQSLVAWFARRLADGRVARSLEWLFALESRLPARDFGSGWLLLARKPAER